MTLTAKDIMTRLVVTAKISTPLEEVVRVMLDRRITGLPIVDQEGKLVGIVAQDDIIFKSRKMEGHDKSHSRQDIEQIIRGGFVTFSDRTRSAQTVESVMTRNVHSATEDTRIQELAGLMWDKRIHRVPICDSKGVLTGIVSSMDICRAVSEGRIGST